MTRLLAMLFVRALSPVAWALEPLALDWQVVLDSGSQNAAYGIAMDSQGVVYVAGLVQSTRTLGSPDWKTAKINPDGTVVWEQVYYGSSCTGIYETPTCEAARDIAVDANGNVCIVGWSQSSGTYATHRIMKYDFQGNILWNIADSFGDLTLELSEGVALDPSTNIFVVGRRVSGGGIRLGGRLTKYDTNGNLQWTAVVSSNVVSILRKVATDGNGNTYVVGNSPSVQPLDIYLLKFDTNGALLWSRGFNSGYDDVARNLAVAQDGSIYVVGFSSSNLGIFGITLLKFDASGNLIWGTIYNTGINQGDIWFHAGLALGPDGSIYVTNPSGPLFIGYSRKIRISKFSVDGTLSWTVTPNIGVDDRPTEIVVDKSSNVYISADSYFDDPQQHYRVLKFVPTIPVSTPIIAGTILGVSSITWSWDVTPGATTFYVVTSTGGQLSPKLSSTTLSWTELGLSTNTAYTRSVVAANRFESSTSTALTLYTVAMPPSGLTLAVMSSTTVSLSWTANTNPSDTRYEVSQSTDNFAFNFSTPIPLSANLAAISTTVFNLLGEITYYFRVSAYNGDGVPTAFDPAIVSTKTYPFPPSPPAVSAFPASTGISSTSINWAWTHTVPPSIDGFRVFAATGGALSGNLTSATTFFIQQVLSPNTTYAVQVQAFNISGNTLSPSATRYTMAAPPVSTVFNAVYVSSLTISWNPNGNPGNTSFEIYRSTDDVAFIFLSSLTASLLTDTQLNNATFYYKVRAKSGDEITTAFDLTISTFLPPQPPSPATGFWVFCLNDGLVELSWGPSLDPDVIQYNIYWDSGSGVINYAAAYSTVSASSTSFIAGPLSSGTYYFGLRAKNSLLCEEKNTNLAASVAIAPSPPFTNWVQARIRTPQPGRKIWGNRVTVLADLLRGSRSFTKEVSFQYRTAGATTAPWVPMSAVMFNNPDPKPPYFIHWDVTGISQGNYEVRAQAVNSDDKPDPAPPTIFLTVNNSAPDTEENAQGISIRRREKVYNTTGNSVVVGALSGEHALELNLLTGALNGMSSAVLNILSPPLAVPAADRELSKTGIYYDLGLESGQTILTVPAVLTVSYRDDDNDGIVDGTLARADRLVFMVYDPAGKTWRKEAVSSVDYANKRVTSQTGHFSDFGVFSPAAANLKSARAYPVPFVPNDGIEDNGKPYNPADPNSGVIFDNLTQTCRIEIYTVSGELVWEKSIDDSSGKIQWDVKNTKGQNVSFGVYIALIRDTSTGEKAVRKIAVIK